MTATYSQGRTDQKLQYAAIHIDELENYPNATSNDAWENAHQESCFYHLAGAVDALLHEINDAYSLGLDTTQVSWRLVEERLGKTEQTSRAFAHCVQLKQQEGSWLNLLFEWRHHGAHRGRVAKIVHASTHRRVDNQFKDPRTGVVPNAFAGMGCQEVLRHIAEDVSALIGWCRTEDERLGQEEHEEN